MVSKHKRKPLKTTFVMSVCILTSIDNYFREKMSLIMSYHFIINPTEVL